MALSEDERDAIAGTYLFLTDVSVQYRLIGQNEYIERREVLNWFIRDDDDSSDPRGAMSGDPIEEDPVEEPDFHSSSDSGSDGSENSSPHSGIDLQDESPPIQLIPRGLRQKWVFTGSDNDPYPSVPHGHLEVANRKWPKLNPYTGRVYSAKEREHLKMRLTKVEMCTLWRNRKFREYARNHVARYMSDFPMFRFHVADPLRFPRR